MASLVCAADLVFGPVALAANTNTWTGATSANLSVGSNWGGAAPAAGDTLVFTAPGANIYDGGGGGVLVDDLGGSFLLGGLIFNANYTGPLTITSGGGNTVSFAGTTTFTQNSPTTVNWNPAITIASGTLTLGTGASSARINIGALLNNGILKYNQTPAGLGFFITGPYNGNGTSDEIRAAMFGSENWTADAAVNASEGGIHVANGGTNDVFRLTLSTDSKTGGFYVENGSTVNVRTLYASCNNSFNRISPALIIRGGSRIVISSLDLRINPNGQIRWFLCGDGNTANTIEFLPKGDLTSLLTNNYSGLPSNFVSVGGINLVQHAATDGTDFSLGDGTANKAPTLTFSSALDGGTWTLAEGTLNVKGYGTVTSGRINFGGNRNIDVQGASTVMNVRSTILMSIADGKTVTKKGVGDLVLDAVVLGTATLSVQEGAARITGTFAPSLTVGGANAVGTPVARLLTNVGGALTLSARGRICPSAGSATSHRTAGSITLNGGASPDFSDAAELGFNFDDVSFDRLSTVGLFTLGSGYFSLNPNLVSDVPTGTYPLVSGGSFSGTFDAGAWRIVGAPAGWFLQQSGTALNLVVASTQWKASRADGNWNTAGNWTTGVVPNGQGRSAEFDDGTVAGSGAVALDGAVTLGVLTFSSVSNRYNLSTSAGTLTFRSDRNGAPRLGVDGTDEISGAQGIEIAAGNTLVVRGAGSLTISAPIGGSGGIDFGCDTTLSAAGSRVAGPVTVSAGTLTVNGSLDDGTSAVSVTSASRATLSGKGAIGRAVVVGSQGWLRPGDNTDDVLQVKSLDMSGGGTLVLTRRGANYGRIAVLSGGSVNIAGATLDVSEISEVPTAPEIPLITGASSLTGEFAVGGRTVPERGAVTVCGREYGVTYRGGAGGNDVILTLRTGSVIMVR